jgi:hypothetical protein
VDKSKGLDIGNTYQTEHAVFMWVLDCSWSVTADALKFEQLLMKGLLILSLWKNSMHVVHVITCFPSL